MGSGRLLVGAAALAALLLGAGCLGVGPLEESPSPSADTGQAEVDSLAEEPADEDPATHRLTLLVDATPRAKGFLGVEAVELSPTPAPAERFSVGGPAALDAGPTTAAAFDVPAGHTLDAFEVELVVHDGLGPARLTLDVPAWSADGPAAATVHLDAAEVGTASVDRVEGPVDVEAVNDTAKPLYGVLEWPDGPRKALTGFDHVVHVPDAYPRFPANAKPTFEVDTDVSWTLDGEPVAQGATARLDPGPGKHELLLEGPDEQSTTLTFSVNDRLHVEDTILVGTPDHREPVAGANVDTHNVTIHEGATHLSARLVPIGEESEVEDLDLYALNETGAMLDQSADDNGSRESLTVSRSDIRATDVVQLRVDGDIAAATEYKLTASTFYRPW